MSDRTYAPDVESTPARSRGLPDDPNLEMQLAGWVDARCRGCGAAIFTRVGADPLCPRCQQDDGRGGAALFPEVATWTDDQLVTAIELADRREPALRLGETEHYDAFLHECSAELVGRLEGQGVRFAA